MEGKRGENTQLVGSAPHLLVLPFGVTQLALSQSFVVPAGVLEGVSKEREPTGGTVVGQWAGPRTDQR